MSLAIHLLNKPDDSGQPRLLKRVSGATYRTCCWKLPAEDVAQIDGGWVYLHDTKAEGARMGGVVTAVEPATEPGYEDQGRYAITFTSRSEAKKVRWRGALHAMAWTGGVIEADATHEA